jgi:hypothetical protein
LKFGNLKMAVAAYNAGPFGVQQAMAEGGREWERHLPEETQGYLRRIEAGLKDYAQLVGLPPDATEVSNWLKLAQDIVGQGSNLANLLAQREQQRREARFGGLMSIVQELPTLLRRALPPTEYLPGAEPGGVYEHFARMAGLPFTPIRTASIPSVSVPLGALWAAAEGLGAPTEGEGLLRLYLDKLNQVDVSRFTEEAQRLLDEGVDVWQLLASAGFSGSTGPDESTPKWLKSLGRALGIYTGSNLKPAPAQEATVP